MTYKFANVACSIQQWPMGRKKTWKFLFYFGNVVISSQLRVVYEWLTLGSSCAS